VAQAKALSTHTDTMVKGKKPEGGGLPWVIPWLKKP